MSIDAMAMAGMDYKESGISLEEWDPRYPQQPPLYLVAENVDAKWVKSKIREWAKAVASTTKQHHVKNDKCEGALLQSLVPLPSLPIAGVT
ncbi:hypothetical protein RJT34_09045 [Clitoria ternatea]|uniref:Uncharacterized protein n=1 Tax=Clitoria ternatea TaxID=43366 RepID=A0AAN9K6G6_CLITE